MLAFALGLLGALRIISSVSILAALVFWFAGEAYLAGLAKVSEGATGPAGKNP